MLTTSELAKFLNKLVILNIKTRENVGAGAIPVCLPIHSNVGVFTTCKIITYDSVTKYEFTDAEVEDHLNKARDLNSVIRVHDIYYVPVGDKWDIQSSVEEKYYPSW